MKLCRKDIFLKHRRSYCLAILRRCRKRGLCGAFHHIAVHEIKIGIRFYAFEQRYLICSRHGIPSYMRDLQMVRFGINAAYASAYPPKSFMFAILLSRVSEKLEAKAYAQERYFILDNGFIEDSIKPE